MWLENRHLLNLHRMFIAEPAEDEEGVADTPVGLVKRDPALAHLFKATTEVDMSSMLEAQVQFFVVEEFQI